MRLCVRAFSARWSLKSSIRISFDLFALDKIVTPTMSNLYNLEPQPTAKVILRTTTGDLSLELFAKQTPLASRNFLQHCLDGYYDGTIFHRLVPGFIIQGGDPTGTGEGGISAINDGLPFEDEVHSRLKYNRRGLLGMANEGKDSNTSQFFLTLGATPELQGKNTMFGRIEGETIYNLMKMAEAELESEGSERPMYPTRVTGSEILVNPFADMVARVKEAPRTREVAEKGAKKRKKPVGKQVLSFADGEEEDAAPAAKKVKANPKLVAAEPEEAQATKGTSVPSAPMEKRPTKAKKAKSPTRSPSAENVALKLTKSAPAEPSSPTPEPEQIAKTSTLLDKTNAEIAALKASMKRNTATTTQEKHKPKNALKAMIPATSTRGRKRGKAGDEKGAFDMFKAFKQRLGDLPPAEEQEPANGRNGDAHDDAHDDDPALTSKPEAIPAAPEDEDDEAVLCDLHFIANCQSCKSWDEEKPDGEAEEDGDDDPGWMAHSLSFAKDTLGKDLEWKRKMAEIEVIDPREKARGIAAEKRRGKDGREKR